MYRSLGWNAARSVYQVHAQAVTDTLARAVTVTLSSELPDLSIRYTLDDTALTPASSEYNGPLIVRGTGTLHAALLEGTSIVGPPLEQRFKGHKAAYRKPVYRYPVSSNYPGGGAFGLVDMIRGTAYHHSGQWQGFSRTDVDLTIDLGEPKAVSRLSAGFLQNMAAQIFLPDTVEYALSTDDSTWNVLPTVHPAVPPTESGVIVKDMGIDVPVTPARYVRLRAKNLGVCPPWHVAAGREAWIFIDELVVE
jgi:hexosaminidase